MFITFIIIVGLCLFAFGFFYLFNNRTAERDIRVHGGDAFEAAYARPRDKLLVKKALLQENNLLDLVTVKGKRVQRETGLSENFDKQGEQVMKRELRQHKHFAELAEVDTEQIGHRLKGERLQLEHYHLLQRKLGSGAKLLNEPQGNPAMNNQPDIDQGLTDLDRLHIRIQKECEHEESLRQTCGDEAAQRYREALLRQQGNESLAQHYQRKVKNQ